MTAPQSSSYKTFVKMVLDRWYANINKLNELLNDLEDEILAAEIAPGKNRGIYLIGHLVAVHDDMFRILNFSDIQYPSFKKIFLEAADKSVLEIPSPRDLRSIWNAQCSLFHCKFQEMSPQSWMDKHAAVRQKILEKNLTETN